MVKNEILAQLKGKIGKKFVAVEFRNGHFHTVKAYGTYNMWVGSKSSGLRNQVDYIAYIDNKEHTDMYSVLATDNESRAIDVGIISDDGGFI